MCGVYIFGKDINNVLLCEGGGEGREEVVEKTWQSQRVVYE